LDANGACDLASAEKQQACSGWLTHLGKSLEYGDVSDAVDDKVVAWAKSSRSKDVAAECRRILFDPSLTKVLQRFAVAGIAPKPSELASQKITKARPLPTEGFGYRCAYRGLAAAYLAGEAEQQTHAKSKAI
jgi:hypothetical protein